MLYSLTEIHSWYDYRRKRFWAVVFIALYTLAGFFAVPAAINKFGPELGSDYLQRSVSIGDARFNPWTLRLELIDFALTDTNDANLAKFESLVINLQTSSLFRWALVFHEITLTGPEIDLIRDQLGNINFGLMLADLKAASVADAATDEITKAAEEGGGLRLKVSQLTIINGIIDARDELREEPFDTRIEPINIAVSNLSTLPDVQGAQQVKLTTENGVDLTWMGSLTLNPLLSAGRLEMTGSPLAIAYRYFEDQLGFELDNCCFRIELDYSIETLPDGVIGARVNNFNLLLSDVFINQRDTDESDFTLPAFRISGGTLAWPEQTASIELIEFENPEINIWKDAEGILNIDKLIITSETSEAFKTADPVIPEASGDIAQNAIKVENAPADNESAWTVSLHEFRITDMSFGYSDRSLRTRGDLNLTDINLNLANISNQPKTLTKITASASAASGGQLNAVGNIIILPEPDLTASINIKGLNLTGLQPWAAEVAQIEIESGVVDIESTLASNSSETLDLKADVNITNFSLRDTLQKETLIGWEKLSFINTQTELDANQFEISQIELLKPFVRVNIAADGTTNFQSVSATGASESSKATPPPETTTPAMAVRIGQTKLIDGTVDFSDASLPLPFRALISEFGGTMTAIDSRSSQPSELDFNGKVGEYGLAQLDGTLSVMAPTEQTDISLDFRNLSMPDFSPYTVDFAGRKINSGKLDLGLDYAFTDNKVLGQNKVFIADLSLGERIESEDAMSLPLDLAVALLRDTNGDVDIDLEINGDLEDPDFSAGGIIMKAFANLIVKLAASPFKLLGGLVPGGENIDLEAIEFQPGLADLTPPEREKLAILSTSLSSRPTLKLQINGGFNAKSDLPALRAIYVENQLINLIGTVKASDQEMLTRKTRKALEKLTKQQLPDISLRQLKNEYKLVNSATGKKEFDELAYMAELRIRLEATQPIDDTNLRILGEQRRDTIIAFISAQDELAPTRYTTGDVLEIDMNDDGWLRLPLTINVQDEPSTSSAANRPSP